MKVDQLLSDEPLLIIALRKLLSDPKKQIFYKSLFTNAEIIGIGSTIVDQPAGWNGLSAYSGAAWKIMMRGSTGIVIVPGEEDNYTISKTGDNTFELKAVKK